MTSSCKDTRTYSHPDSLASHDQTYDLLKIEGKWWMNENLAFPLVDSSKYRGSGVWSATDIGLYSCPGNNGTTTVDCASVKDLGYLYQWSGAMGAGSGMNVCPVGWKVPSKENFTSPSGGYWPVTTGIT